jgi:hypothetical protein
VGRENVLAAFKGAFVPLAITKFRTVEVRR